MVGSTSARLHSKCHDSRPASRYRSGLLPAAPVRVGGGGREWAGGRQGGSFVSTAIRPRPAYGPTWRCDSSFTPSVIDTAITERLGGGVQVGEGMTVKEEAGEVSSLIASAIAPVYLLSDYQDALTAIMRDGVGIRWFRPSTSPNQCIHG